MNMSNVDMYLKDLEERCKQHVNSPYMVSISVNNENYFLTDSRYTVDNGWETMVFHCNEDGVMTDPTDLAAERYLDKESMFNAHSNIAKKFGTVISFREKRD